MKRFFSVLILLCLVVSFATAQQQQQQAQHKEITVQTVVMGDRGGMMRMPQGLQWSPDSSKVAYIQMDPVSQQQALFFFDPATGKSSVLVAAENLAAL